MNPKQDTSKVTPAHSPLDDTTPGSSDRLSDGPSDRRSTDGIDRRNFLSCMAWAGTGLLWTMAGGVPTSRLFAATTAGVGQPAGHAASGFSFVQISDSHIGFNKAANQDVTGTLKLAIDKINGLPVTPELLLHTGDVSQSSKPLWFRCAAADNHERQSRPDVLCPGRA